LTSTLWGQAFARHASNNVWITKAQAANKKTPRPVGLGVLLLLASCAARTLGPRLAKRQQQPRQSGNDNHMVSFGNAELKAPRGKRVSAPNQNCSRNRRDSQWGLIGPEISQV